MSTRSRSWSRAVISSIVLVLLVLASCSRATPVSEGEEGAEVEIPAGEKTTVSFWYGTGATAECVVENSVDPFNEQSDSIVVEVVHQAEQWDATRTALAGGAGPDIVVTPGPSFVYELVQAGQLLPLDEFVHEFGWDEFFLDWALSLGEVEGELYSVPDELETLVLYYNQTLFEENGWEPPETMDEMFALSEMIEEEGIIPFGHGNAEWRPANEWFVGEFLNHVAGPEKVYAALTGEIPWTDPDFVYAIELLDEAQQEGWFMGGLGRYYTATFDEFRSALGNGDAAMNIEGTWFLADIADYFGEEAGNDNEWDWVPVPSTTGEAIFDIGSGSTYSINRNAEDTRAAAEFLTYFFQPETQSRILGECNFAPAPVELEAEAMIGIDDRVAEIFDSLSEASEAGNYGYTTWTFWPPKSDVYIYEEIERVWAGEITPEEYMQGLQEIFEEELAAGEIPPIPSR